MESRRGFSISSSRGHEHRRVSLDRDRRGQLVTLFLERCGQRVGSSFEAIEECVERLRTDVGLSTKGTLAAYLKARRVLRTEMVPDLDSAGVIRPLGPTFADGFSVAVSSRLPELRRRFTEAHELCHTFFYELVPEIKFQPHRRDELEEAVCNHGAAALLIPRDELLRGIKTRAISLTSLEELAGRYGVAVETMFLRIRHLRLWDCHLSVWHRDVGGQFLPLQVYGWEKANWRWVNDDLLEAAWAQPRTAAELSGWTFVYHEDPAGYSFARPIHYRARRHGRVIFALSRDRPFPQGRSQGILSFLPRRQTSRAAA